MEPWVLPVIQGYMEIHTLVLHSSNPPNVLQGTQREAGRSGQGERGEEKRGEVEGEPGEEGDEEEKEEEEGVVDEDMITFSPKIDGEFKVSVLL